MRYIEVSTSLAYTQWTLVTHYTKTSLRCHWQTRATRFLTSTMLGTNVDGQCDKLVTDGRHLFITLTGHLSWQHLRRSTCSCEIFLSPEFGWKFRSGVPLIWRHLSSLATQCMISRGKLLCPKRTRSVLPFSYSAGLWRKWGSLGVIRVTRGH